MMRTDRVNDDTSTVAFQSGLDFGNWVFEASLAIDRAHAVMLREEGVISSEVVRKSTEVLDSIEEDGYDSLDKDTDVHTTVENELCARLGTELGGRLHVGRSRNDKFATWLRMAIRSEIVALTEQLVRFRRVLLRLATETSAWVMAGYTCLQPAQPTTLGHHLLGYESAFARHFDRLLEVYQRVNRCPLGSAALSGTGIPINRQRTADLLGFEAPTEHSMAAVASRDISMEAVSDCTTIMNTMSRLAGDIILWSNPRFGFVQLASRFTGTSSIMPQKRNPTAAELVRAKSGRVAGEMSAILSVLQGLPMAYNNDLQEVTRIVRDSFERTTGSLMVLTQMMDSAEFDRERLQDSVEDNWTVATELADTLVTETEIPFGTAHAIVSTIAEREETPGIDEVMAAIAADVDGEHPVSRSTIATALNPRQNVDVRSSTGAPGAIDSQLEARRKRLRADSVARERIETKLVSSEEKLDAAVEAV
jgi:argininosuccinate lyase